MDWLGHGANLFDGLAYARLSQNTTPNPSLNQCTSRALLKREEAVAEDAVRDA